MIFHTTNNVCVILIEGDLVEKRHNIIPPIEAVIEKNIQDSVTNFIINLKEVDRVDSTGIGKLLVIFKTIEKKKGKVVFCQAPRRLIKNFEEMQLDKIFKVFETENNALQFFTTKNPL